MPNQSSKPINSEIGLKGVMALASLFIGLSGVHPAQSAPSVPPATLSEKILKMEESFEQEFEDFFEEDMAEVSQDPAEIAQTLARISKESGTNPGVLWVVPREDHLHLVLILPGGTPIVRDLYDVPQAKLLSTVAAFQKQINDPKRQWNTEIAQQLHQWLLGPFEQKYLQAADIDTLLFCLGNGVRGLPLAALHDGERYLVEKYSSSKIPAFNLIQTDYKRHKPGKILAAGASSFFGNGSFAISALRSYHHHETSCAPIGFGQGNWQGQSLLNRNFTLENFKSQLDDQTYNIVHLATHAEFKPGRPQQSFIQFRDTRLTLDQMGTLNWSNPSLDLLVLSACKNSAGRSHR